MTITKRLRYEVLRRDNHTCRYCGGTAPEVKLTVDHVLPVALGGSDDSSNLVADCNAGKSSSNPDQPLVDAVSDDAIRWAAAIKKAGEAVSADRKRIADDCELVLDFWKRWTYTPFNGSPTMLPLPLNWSSSIEGFIRRRLPLEVLMEALDIGAQANVPVERKWRYAMGVAWKRQTEMEEAAHSLLIVDGEENV